MEENNYYPFGLQHKGYNELASSEPSGFTYKFGGKELNEELGLNVYDFGARNYNPALGRWMNIDPMAEQMRRFSPYNYAFNNPVVFVDPDGMAPIDWYIDWRTGRVLGQDGAKTNNIRIIKGNVWSMISKQEGGTNSKTATSELQKYSSIIKINNNKIQTDINTINNSTIADQANERQAFFVVNRGEDSEGNPTAELSSRIGPEGGKNGAEIPPTNGFENDELMVGQIHTHDLAPKGETNIPGASTADYESSNIKKFNIYSIDSYQGIQEDGNKIYMTNPNTPPLPGLPMGTTLDTGGLGSQVLDDYIKLNQ